MHALCVVKSQRGCRKAGRDTRKKRVQVGSRQSLVLQPSSWQVPAVVSSVYLASETPTLSWWTHGLLRNSSTPQRLHLSKVKARQKRWMMVSSLLQKISKKQESWYLPVLSAAALSLPQSRAGGDLGTTLRAGLFKVIQRGNQNMYVCLAWSQPQRHSIYGSCPCL